MCSKFDQLFDRSDGLLLRRLMGMAPDGAVDFLEGLSDFTHLVEPPGAGPDRHHPADPCPLRSCHHFIPLLGEIREVQMAVTVDQHRAQFLASSPKRWNT